MIDRTKNSLLQIKRFEKNLEKMIADDDMEQYGELDEATFHNYDSSFYDSPTREIHTKKSKFSSRKRSNLDREHPSINIFKKHKETTKDRLVKWNNFYSNEKFGILVQCTKCKKWRKVFEYEEEHKVPTDWCCAMNLSGPKDCNEPESVNKEDFSPMEFVPGSIVWAKLCGYPWWPGMIEDDPDTEEYYWIEDEERWYNVTFLDDKVTRSWVPESFVLSFLKTPPKEHLKNYRIHSQLIENAKKRASAAIAMPIKDRLKNFSFANQYKGKWPLAENFDNDDEEEEDGIDLTEMLIKEVEEIDSIKSSDSENETISLNEDDEDDSNYRANEIKKYTSGNNKSINLKQKKGKRDVLQPKNSNQELEKVTLYERNQHYLTPKKIKEKEIVSASDNKKKNNLIKIDTAKTMAYKRKKNKNKPEHVLSKLDENKSLISNSMKTERKNKIMTLDRYKYCPQELTFTNQSQVRWNKPNEKTVFINKENKNKLSNIKSKKFLNNKETGRKILQNAPIKSGACKIPNSKKKISFQPPIKDTANTVSKHKKENDKIFSINNNRVSTNSSGSIQNKHTEQTVDDQTDEDISDEEKSKLEEPKTEMANEQKIREEEDKIYIKNKAKINSKGKQNSHQSLNNDSHNTDTTILDSIPNSHTEKIVTKQTEGIFDEKKSKQEEQTEIENKEEIGEEASKSCLKNEEEINIHNSRGKQKSQNITEVCIFEEKTISDDKESTENSKISKTQDKSKTKKLESKKGTKINKTKSANGEKSVSSNDQIVKTLEDTINGSVGRQCILNSTNAKNCPNDNSDIINPQSKNLGSNSLANNIENKVHKRITSCVKSDSKQENNTNNEKQKRLEKANMESSKQNTSNIIDNAKPKQISSKKYEDKKTNNMQLSNSTESNISKQENVMTKPDGQCYAKVSKESDIETSKKEDLLCTQDNSKKKPKAKKYKKIPKKISNKNHTNTIDAEETSIMLNNFDDSEQNNYSFSLKMNNEQNTNEDSDPFEEE